MATRTRATGKGRNDSAPTAPKRDIAVAVLGAGAPHASLMAGALAATYHAGKTFDVFFTSGGGALMGLLFVAPRIKTPIDALRDVAEFGVDERIYRLFPIGYKTFFKQSRFTRQVREWAEHFKVEVAPRPFPGHAAPPGYDPRQQRRRRLYNDVVDFWASVLTPPRLGPTSLGLCDHLPFLEDMVDFPTANRRLPPSGLDLSRPVPVLLPPAPGGERYVADLHPGWFYVNAYNLDAKELEQFQNKTAANTPTGSAGALTPAAIRAALSFPFIYPPQEINGARYCEGALIDPLNLPGVVDVVVNRATTRTTPTPEKIGTIRFFLFDILGALEEQLMSCPQSLWDAYGLSILTPVISLAKMSKKIFGKVPGSPELVRVDFTIPAKSRARPLDWSYANTTALWDEGWATGEKLVREHKRHLPDRQDRDGPSYSGE